MRLIDANQAQNIADNEIGGEVASLIQYVLSHAPTIEAEPVVHCRECKHWRVGLDRTNTWCARLNGMETVEHDYCSFGAKMDGDSHA